MHTSTLKRYEDGGQFEFLLKVKQGDGLVFGVMNSDHLHEYYGYLVQHPELLIPVSGNNADFKALVDRGSLLGSVHVIGDNNNGNNENDNNNNNEERGIGRLKNMELISALSALVGEGKLKENGVNALVSMNEIANSSRLHTRLYLKNLSNLKRKRKYSPGKKTPFHGIRLFLQ